jgi:hypothetical protein
MDGIGTDEKSLSRIAVLYSDDMINIRLRYKSIYGNTLRSTIEVSVTFIVLLRGYVGYIKKRFGYDIFSLFFNYSKYSLSNVCA